MRALGALPLPHNPADLEIPDAIAAQLNTRERLTVAYMVSGRTYAQALDACRVPPRSPLRDVAPPPAILAAVDAIVSKVLNDAGNDRRWIIAQTVALYERAALSQKLDGATAAKCLTMLAEWEGSLYPRKHAGFAPGQVADLLAAVAGRGRAPITLEQSRAQASVPAALPQTEKAQ